MISLEEQISKVHKLCLQRRNEIECCVQQCRTLLKPWPLKSKIDKKDEQHTESTVTQDGEPIIGETEAESKAKEAEKQDMAALEVLLAKAQKAREIQTKMDEAAAKANQKKKISKKPLPVTTKPPLKQPVQHIAKQSLPKAAKPVSKQPAPVRKPAPQKPAIKSTYSSSYGRPSSAKSLMRPSGSRGSAKMYLDSVLKKGTHSKTISREQGHIPSRTGAGPSGKVTELQRSTTPARLSVTRKEKDNDTRTHTEQSCHDSQIALSSEKDFTASDELLEKANSVNKSTECSGESQVSQLQVDNAKQLALNDGVNKPLGVTGIPCQSSGLGNLDNQSKTEEINILQECKKESLDPFSVDAEFVLPGKYHKLKSTSTRLYSELRKIIEKDGKPSPCQHFVERLEAGFDVGNISTRNEIQDKANGLLEEHEQLSTLTDAVVIRSCSLRDDASWQEVYKCYRHWQIVLSKFNELQRRTQRILEVQEQLTKCCPCGNCGTFDRDHPRDTSSVREGRREGCVLLSRWLPDEFEHYSSVELCEGLDQQYGTVDFTYSSVKELHELVQLHHEVQLLCLQLHVKQLAAEKLLPLLEKLDPSDSAFVPLYRVTHGLLCGGGKVFPAMVLDNF
ncbi:hypothetical protein OS493_013167 [Desmophyllum pertusum]|uniref:Uncharacterized protein n=1 Tax=Desmophyllum pertusum TaxID=174260 RepID=A0A9X0CKR6_9CNID|nr:hypothetical protein OS493_013167 [Desmophyllum pertusum]